MIILLVLMFPVFIDPPQKPITGWISIRTGDLLATKLCCTVSHDTAICDAKHLPFCSSTHAQGRFSAAVLTDLFITSSHVKNLWLIDWDWRGARFLTTLIHTQTIWVIQFFIFDPVTAHLFYSLFSKFSMYGAKKKSMMISEQVEQTS